MKNLELKQMENLNAGSWAAFGCGVGVGLVVIGTWGATSPTAALIYIGCMAAFFDKLESSPTAE